MLNPNPRPATAKNVLRKKGLRKSSSPAAKRSRPRALRSVAEIEELMRDIDEFAQKVKSTAVLRSAGGKA